MLDFGDICTLVCCGHPIWGEYNISFITQHIDGHPKEQNMSWEGVSAWWGARREPEAVQPEWGAWVGKFQSTRSFLCGVCLCAFVL